MTQLNPYFPCTLVEQDDDYSIICSQFHYFDDHFKGREVGGYTVERLAKRLAKQNSITGIKYDSEAGMFCAYSPRKGPLKQLCTALRKTTGSQRMHQAKADSQPKIPLEDAEKLLLKGFVLSLNKPAQKRFLKQVPVPAMSKLQAENIRLIQKGTDQEKIKAARKVNSEARTRVRDWANYLSHPSTTGLLIEACDREIENDPVFQEFVWALVFIGDRHLPDLRTKPLFLSCLEHKRQQVRILGIMGLHSIYELNSAILKPLGSDKSKKVREVVQQHQKWISKSRRRSSQYPSWMFDEKIVQAALT